MRLSLSTSNCENFAEFTNRPYVSLNNMFVMIFAIASVILSIRYFMSIAKVYKEIREKYLQNEIDMRHKAEAYVNFVVLLILVNEL